MNFEMYEEFFETYNYNMVEDSKDHFGYSDWSAVLEQVKIDEAMKAEQMDKVMEYIRADDWVNFRADEDVNKFLRRI